MTDLSTSRVLVTGGTGFLGSHVTELMRRKAKHVFAYGRACNLMDYKQTRMMFQDTAPDVVVHLAASCGGIGLNRERPFDLARDNLMIGANVLDWARQRGCKVVYVGTCCSYPGDAEKLSEDELHDGYPEPTNAPYGLAKRMIGETLIAMHRQYGLPAAYLIPANLYGPRDHFDYSKSHCIPAIIRRMVEAVEEEADAVELWGTGKPTRDFLYVEDAAEAIVTAAERIDDPQPLNVGTGVATSIADIAHMVAALTGYEGSVDWDTSMPDGQTARYLATGRFEDLTGWSAQTTLEDGLKATVDWYKQQRQE